MPITRNTPFVSPEGDSYPFVAVQLIVSPRLEAGNYVNSAVFNFTPFRVVNGVAEEYRVAPSEPAPLPPLLLANASLSAATDPALAQALSGIMTVLQRYVTARGV